MRRAETRRGLLIRFFLNSECTDEAAGEPMYLDLFHTQLRPLWTEALKGRSCSLCDFRKLLWQRPINREHSISFPGTLTKMAFRDGQ